VGNGGKPPHHDVGYKYKNGDVTCKSWGGRAFAWFGYIVPQFSMYLVVQGYFNSKLHKANH
jgi:hypothetical protein